MISTSFLLFRETSTLTYRTIPEFTRSHILHSSSYFQLICLSLGNLEYRTFESTRITSPCRYRIPTTYLFSPSGQNGQMFSLSNSMRMLTQLRRYFTQRNVSVWLLRTPRRQFIELYTDKDATNYFRAIVKAGEKSSRVMELTESIIRQNPAHYSAW